MVGMEGGEMNIVVMKSEIEELNNRLERRLHERELKVDM
jgi:hypothetical protein